jgi:hypothetical protein
MVNRHHTYRRHSAAWAVVLVAGVSCPFLARAAEPAKSLPPAATQRVDFRRDVHPLLVARCFKCHEGDEPESGYRFDDRSSLLAAAVGGQPLVKPGDSAGSRLIRVVAGHVEGVTMPQEGPLLSAKDIGLLRAWIDQGVAWDDELLPPSGGARRHWAFQPVRKPKPPQVKDGTWPLSSIDRFVAAAHEVHRLRPTGDADRRVLIRRLYFDLLGIPPSPEDVEAFVADPSPTAYERLVDRLLASPQYGERWGRHWLDVARFAESEGYESNHPRPFAWRYRDYVVESFNADRPFAQFVRQQLAGDELTPYTDENLIATGFLAAARISSNEEDKYLQRNDVLVDIANTTGNAFLGLTVQCAQCHDHKFDPFTQHDYYRLQGFFVGGQPANLTLKDERLWAEHLAAKPAEYDRLLALKQSLYTLGRQRRVAEATAKLSAEQLAALDTPPGERSAAQERIAREAELSFQLTPEGIERGIPPEDRKRYDAAKKRLAELDAKIPPLPQTWGYYSPATSPHALRVLPQLGFYPLPFEAQALRQAKPFLLVRGDVHQRGELLAADVPEVLRSDEKPSPPKQSLTSAERMNSRTALAAWITNSKNPLAARVWVNRLWQYHFGRGLVTTADNFGLRGQRPSHPELLDWLAAEFLDSGGSTKHIQRLIVTSHTYRLASRPDETNQRIDPENKYLWRWLPRRIDAEVVRDALLSVSGELELRVGGPSVPADQESRSTRRALYQFQKRDAPPPLQSLFDGPVAMAESCSRRHVSTTPTSTLVLLNHPFVIERAQAMALRISQESSKQADQTRRAFQIALSRSPTREELARCLAFLNDEARRERTDERSPSPLALLCHVLVNANEFSYIH